MEDKKTKNIVKASLFMAIIIISTIIIRFPTPLKGYINLGDTFCILSSWILGPIYGFISSAFGSMIADLITGTSYYAIGSFIIKGLMAVIASYTLKNKEKKGNIILSATLSELVMVIGYFIYSSIIFSDYKLALTCVLGDIIQGVVSVVLSVILFHLINRKGILR